MITLSEMLGFLYTLTLLFLMNSSSNFFFWILLECNMILFLSFLFYSQKNFTKIEGFDLSLYYLIIQSLGSIVFLSYTLFSNFMSFNGSVSVMCLSIMFKSGLFPFMFWIFNSVNSFSMFSLSLLISIQKIPLYLFLFSITNLIMLFFILVSMIFGSFFIFYSKFWGEILVSSSIYSVFWFFFVYQSGVFNFFHLFLLYSMVLFFFSLYYYIKNFHELMDFVIFFFFFMFFLGLPPLSMFFFKLYFLKMAFESFSFVVLLLIWSSVFLSLFGYFKFFFSGFFCRYSLFKNYNMSSMKNLYFILTSFIFPMVLSFSSKLFKLLSSYLK